MCVCFLELEQKWQTQISVSQQSLLKQRVLHRVHLEPFKPMKLLWHTDYCCESIFMQWK